MATGEEYAAVPQKDAEKIQEMEMKVNPSIRYMYILFGVSDKKETVRERKKEKRKREKGRF